MKPFEDWRSDQEITYTIVVKMNDSDLYYEETHTGDSACEAVGRAERYLDRRLAEEYQFEEETSDEALELSNT